MYNAYDKITGFHVWFGLFLAQICPAKWLVGAWSIIWMNSNDTNLLFWQRLFSLRWTEADLWISISRVQFGLHCNWIASNQVELRNESKNYWSLQWRIFFFAIVVFITSCIDIASIWPNIFSVQPSKDLAQVGSMIVFVCCQVEE